MKHNIKSKKHYNIKKSKGKRKQKTNKMTVKRGGGLSWGFSIPGIGSAGKCDNKQIWENGQLKTQECYEVDGNKVYKTVQPNTGANGAKPWYQFW
jgi:hypothetical protein